ncbi:hypothetical protein [Vibrio sp. SCSIO 43136]|uniref:hypothetical protein n=1 Tax=Vibrio sp. SCSIO 43136 TaxID=2819101 RepID=UPI0020764A08|nr:hypothetical protein [Vibrio sp. SCSIO 43136]USD67826.1 hypothetical protein J4N39_16700 [Vibrio sp. SCSIO 43136]
MKNLHKKALLMSLPFMLTACGSDSSDTASETTNDASGDIVFVAQPAAVFPYPTTQGYVTSLSNTTSDALLGNPEYQAMSYGAYRSVERTDADAPTVEQIKQDLLIMQSLGIKVIRTYNTQDYPDTERLLEAIDDFMNPASAEYRPGFEMFVMLGIWVDALNAWDGDSSTTDHNTASAMSRLEMDKAIELVNNYPEIIKVLAVGNEAMVHWAGYHVAPKIILDYVNELQGLKSDSFTKGYSDGLKEIPSDVWITSSDNFASWAGEGDYANDDLAALVQAVDYVSVHSYPFHDSFYNSEYWTIPLEEQSLSKEEQIAKVMERARDHALEELKKVQDYLIAQNALKQIHIGETGWSTVSSDLFGATGTGAADEYKQKLYNDLMREWSDSFGASLFFFEAFDEQWKAGWGSNDADHSEKHFGLIDKDCQAKYLLWDKVDAGVLDGLTRDCAQITKTYSGNLDALMLDVQLPPYEAAPVSSDNYSVIGDTLADGAILNWWGGNSGINLSDDGQTIVLSGGSDVYPGWWGVGVQLGSAANLTGFESGSLNFSIKSSVDLADVTFKLGFQTGSTVDHWVRVGGTSAYPISTTEAQYSIPLSAFASADQMDLTNVPTLLYFLGAVDADGESYIPEGVQLEVTKVYYSK